MTIRMRVINDKKQIITYFVVLRNSSVFVLHETLFVRVFKITNT